jgi:hypothetical protein
MLLYGLNSADPLNLPEIGDVFKIYGTTVFGNLYKGWAGRKVTLVFDGILTVYNGTNTYNMQLSSGANFTTANGSTLTLVSDGDRWYEVSRSN